MGERDFDYIVIGSGPAGRTVACELARAKKRVAIVEATSLGGTEINTRDLPSKISLDFAHNYHALVSSPAISQNSCHFNFPTLTANIDKHIQSKKNELLATFKNLDIRLIEGFAHFLDAHTIAVGDQKFTGKNFILATGSQPKTSEISGLDTVKYLTPSDVFRTRKLPRFVFVVGGGPTGVEIAEYFASLGTGVIIMERGAHLLPREDDEIADFATSHLKNLGATVVAGSRVTAIAEDYNSKIVVFMNGTSEKMVRVDAVVLATGSEPFLDYSLENAGVEYKKTGIITDKFFSTTARNIFAIGDCLGNVDSSTARVVEEAHTLANNLLHRAKSTATYTEIPRIINTYPSIAVLGLNERDATSRDLSYKKSTTPLDSSKNGFVKILKDHKNHFLGCSIVAENVETALEAKKLLTN